MVGSLNSAGENMRTGHNGRIAVYWSQTELDGLEAAPLAQLSVGAAWSWRGSTISFVSEQELGRQAAAPLPVDIALSRGAVAEVIAQSVSQYASIEISNGAQSFAADVVRVQDDNRLVLIFENGCPARGQEFWINAVTLAAKSAGYAQTDDTVVAFPSQTSAAEAVSEHLAQVVGFAAE